MLDLQPGWKTWLCAQWLVYVCVGVWVCVRGLLKHMTDIPASNIDGIWLHFCVHQCILLWADTEPHTHSYCLSGLHTAPASIALYQPSTVGMQWCLSHLLHGSMTKLLPTMCPKGLKERFIFPSSGFICNPPTALSLGVPLTTHNIHAPYEPN